MRSLLALIVVFGLLVTPADARDFALRGQWEPRFPDTTYVGIVLIDGERRVTWDSPKDQGQPAKYIGYVAEVTADRMMILLTNQVGVNKTYCDIRASDLLHCYILRAGGTRSDNFLMVRVGPGPATLIRHAP